MQVSQSIATITVYSLGLPIAITITVSAHTSDILCRPRQHTTPQLFSLRLSQTPRWAAAPPTLRSGHQCHQPVRRSLCRRGERGASAGRPVPASDCPSIGLISDDAARARQKAQQLGKLCIAGGRRRITGSPPHRRSQGWSKGRQYVSQHTFALYFIYFSHLYEN